MGGESVPVGNGNTPVSWWKLLIGAGDDLVDVGAVHVGDGDMYSCCVKAVAVGGGALSIGLKPVPVGCEIVPVRGEAIPEGVGVEKSCSCSLWICSCSMMKSSQRCWRSSCV